MPEAVQFARQAPPVGAVHLRRIARPFSFFGLVDQEYPIAPLRRILSQIRQHGGQMMAVEHLDPGAARDLREENEDLAKRCGCTPRSTVTRLSFFRTPFDSLTRGGNEVESSDFLGYALLKLDGFGSMEPTHRIYESVVQASEIPHNYARNMPEWIVRVGGHNFTIRGHLYAQQNGLTCVCAHAACRTAAAAFHPAGDMTYREMNRLIGLDHVTRRLGDAQGLSTDEMVTIIEQAGARCVRGDYSRLGLLRQGPPPFQKYLYGAIESGYPAIVIFETRHGNQQHVVPLFGHTFNQDTWVPSSEHCYFSVGSRTRYIPSESWVSTYIGHDDNFGSNYCVPRHYLRTKKLCTRVRPEVFCPMDDECVLQVIACLPRTVRVNPIDAEAIGFDYLRALLTDAGKAGAGRSNDWVARLTSYFKNNQVVMRPILVDVHSYAAHLRRIRDWQGHPITHKLVQSLGALPNVRLWMLELSVPELFSANLRKLAEVLLWAERGASPQRTFESFFLARLPGAFALRDPSGFFFVRSEATDHVELFGCEESPKLEK